MKKISVALILIFVSVSAFSQLFPKVDKPRFDDASMLAFQFGQEKDGAITTVQNVNFTCWAPHVTDQDGNIVEFRTWSAGADIANVYYAENMKPGTYTLDGFHHIYTDYSKLEEYKKETGEELARYAPYDNLPYHEKQFFPLDEPVVVELKANSIASLGTYFITFNWLSGMGGTTDDRWSVVEDSFSYKKVEPNDNYVVRYMKPWATPRWKKWNVKNSAQPLED